jgi:serine/threonine-protein kinase RsbW
MYKKIRIESSLSNLRIVENAVDEVTSEIGIAPDNYGKILVSTLEAVNNAMLHGNKLNPDKYVLVEISFKAKNLSIKVTDEGTGFSPDKIPDPTIPENIEAVNGRGVFLMSRLADKVIYRRNGASITMVFKDILV